MLRQVVSLVLLQPFITRVLGDWFRLSDPDDNPGPRCTPEGSAISEANDSDTLPRRGADMFGGHSGRFIKRRVLNAMRAEAPTSDGEPVVSPASPPAASSGAAQQPASLGGPASAPASTADSTSPDIAMNPCPTVAEVGEVAERLRGYAALFRDVFMYHTAGETLPAEIEDEGFVLEDPNRFQWVTTMLSDPDRVADYISKNCVSEVITQPRSWEYTIFLLPAEENKALEDPEATMMQCVDNFGAWDSFQRNYVEALQVCNPPFGARPDCFTGLGHYMVTTSACASAYGRMWSIPDATPLANVAQHIISIQNACAALKTQEECLAADTPTIDAITDLHASIPIAHELNFSVSNFTAVAPAPVVCFGKTCPPPSLAVTSAAAPAPVTDASGRPIMPVHQEDPGPELLRRPLLPGPSEAPPAATQPPTSSPQRELGGLKPNPSASVDDSDASGQHTMPAVAVVVAAVVVAHL